ncbi:MAG: YbaB/EbfC family nucleoid-associated protein [Clostridiales Family XIII bacterium]|jgi:DNA-binding YbaB/EbfC family protein|nr:YbaB/EbfC family nucleoid-associated protein [Clostridiales Family XIII bacterium]
MGKGMKAGKKPNPNKGAGLGGGSQMQQMRHMQAIQQQMAELQSELGEREVETTAGGGAVKVKVNGKNQLVSLEISKDALDPDDVEMLQDLIVVAVNEGLRQIEEMSQGEMSKLTGGLSLPGMF